LTITTQDCSVDVLQICCSGLNAPLPFANAQAGDFDWDSSFSLTLSQAGISVSLSGQQTLLSDNSCHFVRIDIDANNKFQVTARAYTADGSPAGQLWSSEL
ncbi:MAG: hypothetical protein KKD00_11970, partial [Gammaproteobacteria bacterium]|nr:hypothetical protein [Gammaproteobacteria bacterium]